MASVRERGAALDDDDEAVRMDAPVAGPLLMAAAVAPLLLPLLLAASMAFASDVAAPLVVGG